MTAPAHHSHHGHHHGPHHGHDHAPPTADNERRLFWVMLLTVAFMVVEVVGGALSGSLALMADAGHMLGDAVSLLLAWLAFRLARRPSDARRSFGYHRLSVLAAFVNGLTLFAISLWIVVEAAQRLADPQPVMGGVMAGVAALGLLGNIVGFLVLHGGDRDNLNVRGALLHVMSDLLGSAAAIIAAGIILLTGWTPIDPILSMLVSLLILRGAWDVVRRSAHILVEGTPADIDVAELRTTLHAAVPEVRDIHHMHVWSLTAERTLLTMHVGIESGTDADAVLSALNDTLRRRYAINHTTVQIETGRCPDKTP